MFKALAFAVLSTVLPAVPLNFVEAQKLYEEILEKILYSRETASDHEKVASIAGRLRTAKGWNYTPDIYELLHIVRSQEAHSVSIGTPQLQEGDRLLSRLDAHLRGLLISVEQRVRNPDRNNLARYAEANRKIGLPPPGERRVVFLGDSITALWKLVDYFPGQPFVNRGIGGQTSGEILGRVKSDVVDLKPAVVVVLAGINDVVHEVGTDITRNNLSMIGDLAVANGIRPIFASVLPIDPQKLDAQTPPLPSQRILEINVWLREYCRTKDYFYLDYFSAMVDKNGFLRSDLASDGVHPNAAGYRIMEGIVRRALSGTLARIGPSTGSGLNNR